jgi:hypothetical protein
MKGDGRASLRCFPVAVELAGQDFLIAARPAQDWVVKIADEDWLGIVPGMVTDYSIADLIDAGDITPNDLVVVARDAVSAASGMQWWEACRLAKAIVGQIDVVGALVMAGVDFSHRPIGAVLASAYRLLVENRDEKQRAQFDRELSAVPDAIKAQERYDPEAAGEQFERAFQMYGV